MSQYCFACPLTSTNVSGAFAIGFLTALLARWSPHSYLRLLILVGFLVGLKSHTKDEETVEIFGDLPLEKSERVIKPLFEGVRASANPAYQGNERCVDPEEAYVTSLSSCHMLTFLAIACKKRFTVDGYQDQAVGILEKDRAPKPWGSKQAARFNTPPRLPDASKRVPASRWYALAGTPVAQDDQ